MHAIRDARWVLEQECRALMTRLDRLDYFAVIEPMVTAAAPSRHALIRMEHYLAGGRRQMRRLLRGYLQHLGSERSEPEGPAELQHRFAYLRLRFNALLADFDTFADVMTQRSETPFGVWLAGLDVAARDALLVRGHPTEVPALTCYLDRGHGAAIRRARTRLSTGGENPIAIIRVPRERMVGSGIAASLFHEVGHQAIAVLDLLPSLRTVLRAKQALAGEMKTAWVLWERWISEITADYWAMTLLGVGATMGVFQVLSLPRAFVFRAHLDDPHPFPWIRAILSCRLGAALYPDPQWKQFEAIWRAMYSTDGVDSARLAVVRMLEATLPEFVALLVGHRPPSLRGETIAEALGSRERTPDELRKHFRVWTQAPARILTASPALAFAVLGQAKSDSALSPEAESRTVLSLLRTWALRRALRPSEANHSKCACRHRRVPELFRPLTKEN